MLVLFRAACLPVVGQIYGGTFQGGTPVGSGTGVARHWRGRGYCSIYGGTFQGAGGSTADSVGSGLLVRDSPDGVSIGGGIVQRGEFRPGGSRRRFRRRRSPWMAENCR